MKIRTELTIDEAQVSLNDALEKLNETRRKFTKWKATLADVAASSADADDAMAVLWAAIEQSQPARGLQLEFVA